MTTEYSLVSPTEAPTPIDEQTALDIAQQIADLEISGDTYTANLLREMYDVDEVWVQTLITEQTTDPIS